MTKIARFTADKNLKTAGEVIEENLAQYATLSGTENLTQGTLSGDIEVSDSTVRTKTGVKTNPTFTRASVAYKSDGTQVGSGVARFETGKFDKAVLIEEGTTNSVTNPSFETGDFTGYVSSFQGGLSYWKIMSSVKRIGSYCAYLEGTEEHVWRGFATTKITPTSGAKYIFSVYAKTDEGVQYPINIRTRKSSDGGSTWTYVSNNTNSGVTVNWKRISCEYTVESGVNAISLEIYSSTGNSVGKKVYVDDVQIEQKPYATSFIDGTRSPETLTIPTAGVLNPERGTVEMWGKLPPAGQTYIFAINGDTNNNRLVIYGTNADTSAQAMKVLLGTGNDYVITPTIDVSRNEWHYFAARWTADIVKFTVDTTTVFVTRTGTCTFGNIAYIGSSLGFAQANSLIDDLRISSYARSDTEIEAAYNSNQPLPIDEYTTYKLYFDNDSLSAGSGGSRVSPVYSIAQSGTATGGNVKYTVAGDVAAELVVQSKVSLDGGTTWSSWTPLGFDNSIAGLSGNGTADAKLQLKQILGTKDQATPAVLQESKYYVTSQTNASAMEKVQLMSNGDIKVKELTEAGTATRLTAGKDLILEGELSEGEVIT